MDFSIEDLLTLFKNAIQEGERDELLEFLCRSADEQFLDYVINKISDSIKDYLPLTPYTQSKLCNILNLIAELSEIAVFGADKSICLTRDLLGIASDQNCSVYNLKQVLTMLKNFVEDEIILKWREKNEESLVGPLQLLGKKLPCIGDYECQSLLLEILWQMTKGNRKFWAEMWFDCEKTRSMFLDLNAGQFLLGCRKFLNFINKNQLNVRAFPFKASSVYLGTVQLKKPYRSEFWIDINFDTQSISFFFSSLESGNEDTWETVVISSDMVEKYTIQDKREDNVKELTISLDRSCSQLISSEEISLDGLESNLVQIKYWFFLDISHKIQTIFQGTDAESQIMTQTHGPRKVSDSTEIIPQISHIRKASQSADVVSKSDYQEVSEFQIKRRRVSESSQLVPLFTSENDDIVVKETVDPAIDSQREARKYTHRKKVSSGFVDSAEFDLITYIEEDNMEKSDLQNVIPNIDINRKQTYKDNLRFFEINESENEHDAGSPKNYNRNLQSTSSLFMQQNKESVEILSPQKILQKDNYMVPFIDQDIRENHLTNPFENVEEAQHVPKISQNSQLLAVDDVTHTKSSKSVEEVSLPNKIINRKDSQSKPKSSQSEKLLSITNITQRKSSQSISDLDDTFAISPTPFNNKKITPLTELTVKSSKVPNCLLDNAIHQTPINIKTTPPKNPPGVSSRLSLRSNRQKSQCATPMNQSFNGNKKKRLYNINRAPVYDVPPSAKKSINDSSENFNTSTVNISSRLTARIHNVTNEDNPFFSPGETTPQVNHIEMVNSTVTKDSHLISENIEPEPSFHSSVVAGTLTHEQPQISPSKIANDVLSPEKDSASHFGNEENEVSPIIVPDVNLPLSKKPRIEQKRQHQVLTGEKSVRAVKVTQNSSTPKTECQKKCRKAAMTARKMNKLILTQIGSEGSLEGSQQTHRQNKDSGFSQETDEYDVFAIPSPTEKEPRKRKCLESDETETKVIESISKSSKKRKSTSPDKDTPVVIDEYEFRVTPPQVKRRHRSVFVTDTETGSSEVSWLKKKKHTLFDTPKKCYSNRKKVKEVKHKKTVKSNLGTSQSKSKQKSSRKSRASDSETRSKSALSEFDNFNLVVEKNVNRRSLPQNSMSGLYHALESDRNLRQSINEEDLNEDHPCNNFDTLNELDVHENAVDFYENNDGSKNSASFGLRKSVKMKRKAVQPSTSDLISNVRTQPNRLRRNKKSTNYSNYFVEDKVNVQESAKKQRPKTNSFEEPEINNPEVNNVDVDLISLTEEECHRPKNKLPHGSDTIDGFLEEDANGSANGSTIQNYSEIPNKRVKHQSFLTEDNLNSFNNEETGKKIHLERYLDSLSSASINLQDYRTLEKMNTTEVLEESNSKVTTTKPKQDKLIQQGDYDKKSLKEPLITDKNPNLEKFYIDFKMRKECNIGNSLLQDKDEFQIAEVESNISNNYPFERPLHASTPKCQKYKMPIENLLMKSSVFNILSDEVNNLTYKLFATLKKCMSDFREKMTALRESIVNTADAMISNEANFSESDLLSLARNCRESRVHIQKHLKKLCNMGDEYFESEKQNEKIITKKHKKAILKYSKSLHMAQSVAERALEERFTLKSRSFFKSFLKRMELV